MATRLPYEVAEKLLDKLSNDDAFRADFAKDPRAALEQLGYQTPEKDRGAEGKDPVLPLMQLKGGLASKEKISANRNRMLTALRSGTDDESMLPFNPFDMCAD